MMSSSSSSSTAERCLYAGSRADGVCWVPADTKGRIDESSSGLLGYRAEVLLKLGDSAIDVFDIFIFIYKLNLTEDVPECSWRSIRMKRGIWCVLSL